MENSNDKMREQSSDKKMRRALLVRVCEICDHPILPLEPERMVVSEHQPKPIFLPEGSMGIGYAHKKCTEGKKQ